jgi:hypothetical protein
MMALSPDLGVAGNVLVFIVCTLNWFNGIIVPFHQLQVFWRSWVSSFMLPTTVLVLEHWAHDRTSSTTSRRLRISSAE